MKALFLGALLAVVAWFPLGCSEKTVYRPVVVRDTVTVTECRASRCWLICRDANQPGKCMSECMSEKPRGIRPRHVG